MTELCAAWLWLLLALPCSALAFVLREWILGRLGPDVPPTWVMLATAPALLVFAIPMIPTWHFGYRARRSGIRHSVLPFGITVGLVIAVILLSPFPLLR